MFDSSGIREMTHMQQPPSNLAQAGMTVKQAKMVQGAIITVSVLSLVLLFQPFSLALYSVGAGLVVFAGLVFNLVPLCTPGRTFGSLAKGLWLSPPSSSSSRY